MSAQMVGFMVLGIQSSNANTLCANDLNVG